MKRSLTIALTVDPEIPVPPRYYGGIERIVDMLARGLLERGHRVHLFANAASQCPASLEAWRGAGSRAWSHTVLNTVQLGVFLRSTRPDVLHSFARLAYVLSGLGLSTKMIQSYQRQITPKSVRWGYRLTGGRLVFTACSRYCRDTAGFPQARWVVIPNGVPLERYDFSPKIAADAPLVFLGRLERIKGAHTAIEVAALAGRRLLIAGNHAETGPESEYFKREILPRCDGERVRYIGPVDDGQKAQLLAGALALLFPIEWEEPFGIVMAEAMACGTPVVAFARGATPEVIDHGRTGFLCSNVKEMVDAVHRVPALDRGACRIAVERRFSQKAIVDQYEDLYLDLAGERHGR